MAVVVAAMVLGAHRGPLRHAEDALDATDDAAGHATDDTADRTTDGAGGLIADAGTGLRAARNALGAGCDGQREKSGGEEIGNGTDGHGGDLSLR